MDSLSIRQGDIIWYVDENDIPKLRVEPQKQTTEEIINSLIDPNQERKFDVNRETGQNMLPSMKPTKLKQVTVNPNNSTITIINKFK